MNSVINTGVQGMLQSQRQINQAASDIARVPASEAPLETASELTTPLIEMKVEQNIFDASARVVSTADEMLGVLLDTKA